MMAKGAMVGLLSALALAAVCGALAAATTVAPALTGYAPGGTVADCHYSLPH